MHFLLQHKSDAGDALNRFLSDTRTDSSVDAVRSGDDGELQGRFSEVRDCDRIKRELIPPRSKTGLELHQDGTEKLMRYSACTYPRK